MATAAVIMVIAVTMAITVTTAIAVKNNVDKGNQGHKEGNRGREKNYGKPNHSPLISASRARSLAVNYGLTGYQSLPPGIAKKSGCGKPLPGDCKKSGFGIDAQRTALLSWL